MGEHESKQQLADVQPVQAHAHTRKQQASAKPSTDQVDKLTAQPSGVVIGEQCVFGDTLVGSTTFCTVPITSAHAVDEAEVRVTYAGAREMQIISTPNRLRPDVEGPAGLTPLKLVFQPAAEGSFRGALTVEISSPDGTHQAHHVLVAGRAHADGTPDWDQRDREAIRRQLQSSDQASRDAVEDASEKARDVQNNDTTPHPGLTTGQAMGYAQQFDDLTDSVTRLYEGRGAGVDAAMHDALGYRRPVAVGEGMSSAARLAIQTVTTIAGAYLGGAVKATAVGLISKLAGEVAGAVVKDGVKKVGEAIVQAGDRHEPVREFDREVYEFRDRQQAQLIGAKYAARAAVRDISARLFPIRAKDPKMATKVLEVVIAAVSDNVDAVAHAQRQESSRQWIHYLAHASLGESERDKTLSNIGHANVAPGSGTLKAFDGLIELTFRASANRPRARAELISAKVAGVTPQTLAALANRPLLDAELPIRASGIPATDASSPLTVVRDERGNIVFNDSVGQGNQPAHWFEKKGGGDAEVGARLVLTEIAAEPLGSKLEAE